MRYRGQITALFIQRGKEVLQLSLSNLFKARQLTQGHIPTSLSPAQVLATRLLYYPMNNLLLVGRAAIDHTLVSLFWNINTHISALPPAAQPPLPHSGELEGLRVQNS